MAAAEVPIESTRQKNVFVLCFDGTGNKFSGTEADSNILKLYRMLDRADANMFTFYQPGIGTYITSTSMQTTSMLGRVRSWYMKAKDSAVGSSFAEHVMGGYTFLMKYYSCEDDLYFFGFSRGAYTARFLAEMLDHIGLLSSGNEELTRFAWKTYAKWAARRNDGSPEAAKEEADLYNFMRGFRETFSRPVRRIRFLGLFDTVNSVPRFESAWMQRSKFPYTARSSSKVIRHAVSIDERRAKFRQDLVSGRQVALEDRIKNKHVHRYNSDLNWIAEKELNGHSRNVEALDPLQESEQDKTDIDDELVEEGIRLTVPTLRRRSKSSLAEPVMTKSAENLYENDTLRGDPSSTRHRPRRWSEQRKQQDIEEVWFAGGHADIGGGWERAEEKGEKWMLSHIPLVWMVHEAEKAGLRFDSAKMARLSCLSVRVDEYGDRFPCPHAEKSFHSALEESFRSGLIHDCLNVGSGLSAGSVAFWQMMEYLPFRRMDLQSDGSWKAIRWPLPMGETRDVPQDAQIHHSVINRMKHDENYRPGNLIVGGGGRGVRKAPKSYGIGDWKLFEHEGDRVRETWIRQDCNIEEK